MRIGVISDTHGLLRPEALAALAGSDLLLHAGDVGTAAVLERLAELAPVVAVRGNNDRGDWAERLPHAADVAAAGLRLHVVHDVADLALDPRAAGCAMVIAGHSHRPAHAVRDGVHHLNPGSAGPRRFRLPVTLARLKIERGSIEVEFVELVPGPEQQ